MQRTMVKMIGLLPALALALAIQFCGPEQADAAIKYMCSYQSHTWISNISCNQAITRSLITGVNPWGEDYNELVDTEWEVLENYSYMSTGSLQIFSGADHSNLFENLLASSTPQSLQIGNQYTVAAQWTRYNTDGSVFTEDWDYFLSELLSIGFIGPISSSAGQNNNQMLYSFTYSPKDPNPAVPEPTTLLLMGSGLAVLAGIRKKMKANNS